LPEKSRYSQSPASLSLLMLIGAGGFGQSTSPGSFFNFFRLLALFHLFLWRRSFRKCRAGATKFRRPPLPSLSNSSSPKKRIIRICPKVDEFKDFRHFASLPLPLLRRYPRFFFSYPERSQRTLARCSSPLAHFCA